ncbi:MAG TPA: glutamyl-tRNA reductase [bacterium]|jgi:glutamyl-tRNA reductase
MKLEMIGLSHKTSTVETRQRAAIGPERIARVAEELLAMDHMEGVVIVSTCNRVELYLSPQVHTPPSALRDVFQRICNLTAEEAAATYYHRDHAAVMHLFRVASGLDSQMLGEVQILGQVKTSYHDALELACTNSVLNTLFLRAIECGKLVRHRTAISQGAVSVAYAAVDVAQRVFGNLTKHKILLVGAGDTIRLASKYLADGGAVQWRISNRTKANAKVLADEVGAQVVDFPPSADDIAWADVVVSATSSPVPVVTAATAKKALEQRRDPSLLLDLAMPCDIEASLKNLDNVYLYTVDDFKEIVAANLKAREKEAQRAEKLVEKEVERFVEWYRENRVAPTIQQLQEVLESIRSSEVQNSVKRFTPENHAQVDEFSKSLMRKVTSLIIANMKRASMDKNDLSLARAVAQAFASPKSDVNDVLEKLDHELSH